MEVYRSFHWPQLIVVEFLTLYIIHFHSLARGMNWRNQMWPQLWPVNPNQHDVAEFDWGLAWSSYDQLHPHLLQRLTLTRGGELQRISPGDILWSQFKKTAIPTGGQWPLVMVFLVNHTGGALFSLVIFLEVFVLFQKLGSNMHPFMWSFELNINIKHRKNCECCPSHYLIVNHYSSMSWFKFRNLSGSVVIVVFVVVVILVL